MSPKLQLQIKGIYIPETIKDEIKQDFMSSAIGKIIIQKRKVMKIIRNADSTKYAPHIHYDTGDVDTERYWFCCLEPDDTLCQYQSDFCQVCGNYKLSFQNEIPENAFCYCDLPELVSIVDENKNIDDTQVETRFLDYEIIDVNDYEAICTIM